MTPPRSIPSVDELARSVEREFPIPRAVIVGEARRVASRIRANQIGEAAEPALRRALADLLSPSLRTVVNATGVILHTNLGRAPLGRVQVPAGYSNLEYDIDSGRRGKRDVHILGLIERLTTKPGIVVNNNAAAVYLVLNELAAGHEAIVSRGELIEIGDGFRIPDIMAASGAVLREVGTTNRTSIDDYREAINDRTRLIMRVHPSNFSMSGFTAKPALSELCALARDRALPLYEDLGSGCLVDLRPYGIDEPTVAGTLSAGVDLVSFSGDKLLGGPQCGIISGAPDLVSRIRRNAMFRALRVDKLTYAALECTLRDILLEDWNNVPVMRMIAMPADEIRARAESLAARIPGAETIEGRSLCGGGSTPNQSLPTWLVRIDPSAEAKLRDWNPPVIARLDDDHTVIDLRTVFPDEEETILAALQS